MCLCLGTKLIRLGGSVVHLSVLTIRMVFVCVYRHVDFSWTSSLSTLKPRVLALLRCLLF